MKKKDKGKGGIRMVAGLLLTVCMIFAGALLGGAMTVEAGEVTPTSDPNPAIDFSRTDGSITIHKYEYNRPEGEKGTAGTGKSDDAVPNGATALEGVDFTLYQVKDAKALEAIYQGVGAAEMPKLGNYWDGTSVTGGATLYKPSDDYKNPQTTVKDANGDAIVKFDDLPVGIYLVVETKSPEKVTSQEVFLVSIPTTVDTNNWLYDVHVFPKNATTYGKKVTLLKKGKDGTTETDLDGVTFVLQRKEVEKGEDDKDIVKWKPVTVTGKGNPVTLTTEGGKIEVSDLPPGTYRFIETGIGDNPGYIADLSKAYEFVVDGDGTIRKVNETDDYIVVETKEGDDKGTATITVINEKPDVDKEVKKGNGWAQEADYSISDTISYRIKIRVPAKIEKLTKFWVKDAPSKGIQYTGNLKVYEAAADGTMSTTTIEATDNYTIGTLPADTDAPKDGFIVKFTTTSDTIKQQAGKTIYITYDAVLTENADSATTEVAAGNTNTVDLVFSKYIEPDEDSDDFFPDPPGDDTDDTIEDKAVVYTFQLDIEKTGKDGNDTVALEGVTFDLYRAATADEKNNTNITKVTGTAAKALGLDEDEEWIKINRTELKTNDDGEVSQPGLANGTYYLVETKTQDGYNLLSEPIKVELSTEYITTYVLPGNPVKKHVIAENGISITQSIELKDNNKVVTKVEILNTQGFTLPTTGGAGGFLFAMVGCAVMIVGIILFKKTKKKPESE